MPPFSLIIKESHCLTCWSVRKYYLVYLDVTCLIYIIAVLLIHTNLLFGIVCMSFIV